MEIGKLDQQIQIQSLIETKENGELITQWLPIQTIYAKVKTQRGNEAINAGRMNAQTTIRVLVRYRDDIDLKTRIVWEGQEYNIKEIDRSGRRQGELWFTATAIDSI